MTALFPSRHDKQTALEQTVWPLLAAPRTQRQLRRLVWAIETTPADGRTRELLAAKLEVTPRTIARLLRLAETIGAVQTTPTRGDANRYRIDWPGIFRAARGPNPATPAEPQPPAAAVQTPATNRPAGLYPGGWPLALTRDTLRTVATVQTLYEFAASRNWIGPEDRTGFFALAAAITAAKNLTNPGAVFTRRVKQRDWTVGTAANWEQARQAIAKLEEITTKTQTTPLTTD